MNNICAVPLIGQMYFARIQRLQREQQRYNLTISDLEEFRGIFGIVAERALHILDESTVVLYICDVDDSLQLLEVPDKNDTYYRLWPSTNYCTCSKFTHDYLMQRRQYLCKHILAARLATALEIVVSKRIPSGQFNGMASIQLKSISNELNCDSEML